MRAISALSRDAGISTRVCLAITAFRIRVSISAIGSVISSNLRVSKLVLTHLPTALCHPGHVSLERGFSETEPAQSELPHVRARAAAQVTPVTQPNLVFRLFLFLRDLCGGGHSFSRLLALD